MKIKIYKRPKDQDRRLNNWSANTYTIDSEFSDQVKYAIKNEKFIILTGSCEISHDICKIQDEVSLYSKEVAEEIKLILCDLDDLEKMGVKIGRRKK